jgi:gliding motility-associated protein GldM
MAGGKLSPRQKMINLMYLVFIAMLALNMSKEVLKAFGLMNEKFEVVNKFSEEYNNSLFSTLETKASENPSQFGVPYSKAQKVQQISKEMYTYLGSLKSDVTKEFEREKDGQLPYDKMDKGSYIDENWFEGDGYSPKGKEIMAKLENYKKQIADVFGVDVKYKIIVETLNKKFNFENVKDKEGVSVKYLDYHFKLFPAIASIAKLTSIQNDVKSLEQDIYNALIGNTTAQTASMKNYKAIVIMDKSLFFQGETVTGRVVLGRYDETTVPTSVSVGGASVSMENGQAVFKMSAGAVGDHDIKGKFTFKEDEKLIPIDIEGKYAVVPKPNTASVSSDNMKVIYKGVNNPMTISFPGISDKDVTVSAPGIKKSGNSQYIWNIGDFPGKEVFVTVNAKLPDGKTVSDKQKFRVKDIPPATVLINEKSGITIGSKGEILSADFTADFGEFGKDYKVTAIVKSLSVTAGVEKIPCQGNTLNSRAIAAIKNLSKGDLVIIDATVATNTGVKPKLVISSTFRINN